MSDLVLNQLVLRYTSGEITLRRFHKWATDRALEADFRDPALNKIVGLLTVANEFSEDELKQRVVAVVERTSE